MVCKQQRSFFFCFFGTFSFSCSFCWETLLSRAPRLFCTVATQPTTDFWDLSTADIQWDYEIL